MTAHHRPDGTEGLVDLHIHTTASDGTDNPAQAVEKAAALGLAAIAITDHDSVSGVAEALRAGAVWGVEVIPGIEVSSDYREENVHILGYYIDPGSPALRPVLDWVRNEREQRNRRIVALLAGDGFDISMAALEAAYPDAVLGRPHMAEFLMGKGYISSVKEGFERFLGVGRPYYLPKRRISVTQAVSVIRAAGGVPVLAHPLQYHYSPADTERLVDEAREAGVLALEAYYSEHTPEQQEYLLTLAAGRGLGVSGGSDYHGTRKPHITMGKGLPMGNGEGSLRVPYTVAEGLRSLAGHSRPGARKEEESK